MFQKIKLFLALALISTSYAAAQEKPLNIRVVNFKTCVEKSKLGKQEQTNFDALKKQMETVLEEKDKAGAELVKKLEDTNYLDSISAEAETELKRKFRALSQEIQQQQQQYMQTLQQANFHIVQKLEEMMNKATNEVAKKEKLDMVIKNEGTFYYNPSLDISEQVIQVMDKLFEQEKPKA
jgi:outer membrane protein